MKSFIGRLLGWGAGEAPDEPLAVADAPVIDDPVEMLRDQIRRDVAAGFYDEDVILTGINEVFDGEIDPDLVRREAPRLLREALAEHAAAQKTWPELTDCDRLDAAFAALEVDGVIARQNFSCCGNCGSTEIWEEVQAAEEAGLPARGYAFYHVQDTESAVEGHGIYLGYGACEEGEEAAVGIGQEIVKQLTAHGLTTHWDGTLQHRIAVELDWKKRRGVARGIIGLGG